MAAFPDEEYAERQARTRTKMAEAGVDVLIITDPANMNYLTGYDAWSFYVPQAVIVPANNDAPYWYGRSMDAQSAVLTTTLPRDHILSYADDYVENPAKHPFQYLASVLKEHGRERAHRLRGQRVFLHGQEPARADGVDAACEVRGHRPDGQLGAHHQVGS